MRKTLKTGKFLESKVPGIYKFIKTYKCVD